MRTEVWLAVAVAFSLTPAAAQIPDAASSASTTSANTPFTPAVPSTTAPAVSPEIQQYFDKNILFKDRIRHSFSMRQAVGGQDTVDCIQDDSPPPPVPPSPPTTITPSSLPPVPGLLSNTTQDRTIDSLGRIRACPAGTFGQVRPSISELAPYRTVAEFAYAQAMSHRLSSGSPQQAAPTLQSTGYNHGVAAQYVNNWGMSSDISFQNPMLNYQNRDPYPVSEHSLSQLWLVGDYPEPTQALPSDLQTIEIGWEQTYWQQQEGLTPALFIYSSWNNYLGSCYNGGCGSTGPTHWKLLDTSYTYGAAISVAPYTWPSYSLPNHGVFAIYGSKPDGYWYVYIINEWVGYFWFDSGPLSRSNLQNGYVPSNFIEIGGEVFEGRPTSPPLSIPSGTIHPYIQMGRGANVSVNMYNDYWNFDNNAFSACNYYLDGSGNWQVASPATSITHASGTWTGVERPDCYQVYLQSNYRSPVTTPYLLFGGPGPSGSSCTTY